MPPDAHARRLAAGDQLARGRGHEVARPLHGAHARHPRPARQVPGAAQRPGEEADVEPGVVGDDDASGQVPCEQVGHVVEARRPRQVRGDEPVDEGRPHLDIAIGPGSGVDERGPAALRDAVGPGEHEPDLDNGVGGGGQAGGLQVDDGVADPEGRPVAAGSGAGVEVGVGAGAGSGRRGVGAAAPGAGDGGRRPPAGVRANPGRGGAGTAAGRERGRTDERREAVAGGASVEGHPRHARRAAPGRRRPPPARRRTRIPAGSWALALPAPPARRRTR